MGRFNNNRLYDKLNGYLTPPHTEFQEWRLMRLDDYTINIRQILQRIGVTGHKCASGLIPDCGSSLVRRHYALPFIQLSLKYKYNMTC
jgi:hypothetical protein